MKLVMATAISGQAMVVTMVTMAAATMEAAMELETMETARETAKKKVVLGTTRKLGHTSLLYPI